MLIVDASNLRMGRHLSQPFEQPWNINMKKPAYLCTLVTMLFIASFSFASEEKEQFFDLATAKAAVSPEARFLPDELLVQFHVGVPQDKLEEIVRGNRGEEVEEIKAIRVKRIKVPSRALEQVKNALSRNPHVKFVENNYLADITRIPNDPSYSSQWHMSKVSAPQGWDICTGSDSVGVAIIDTGVDPGHPDLAGKLIPGWNFVTASADTRDILGHGTAVAGTAGALSDNGTGVAGLAWPNPIMPLAVVDATNGAAYSSLANAITYAVNRGMRVINISLAGPSYSWTLQNAVNYAWNNGAVVIASAGNDNASTKAYPAACTNVIAVGATDATDKRSSFSNYGPWLTISAPGTNIYTTSNGGGYGGWSGTSFSAPLTAGLAALIFSTNPALDNQQVKEILINSADDLGAVGFDQYFGYGRINVAKSLVAAQNSVALPDLTPPAVAITSPADGSTVSGLVTVAIDAADEVAVSKVEVLVDGSVIAADSAIPYTFLWDTTGLPPAIYRLEARATDSAGNHAVSQSVNVSVSAPDTPPSLTMDSMTTPTILQAQTLSGTVTDNLGVASIMVKVNSAVETPASLNGTAWSFKVAGLAVGSNNISVTAQDTAGNKTTIAATIVVKKAGDLNDDGMVDIRDALLAIRISVGVQAVSSEQIRVGDLAPFANGQPVPDGVVDIRDALAILRIALGLSAF